MDLSTKDIELESARFEVGSDAEVMEVSEPSGHALGDLEDSVDGLHRCVGEAGSHEGKDSLPVGLESLGEFLEWLKSTAVGLAAPPLPHLLLADDEHVLKAFSQTNRPAQHRVGANELVAGSELLLRPDLDAHAQSPGRKPEGVQAQPRKASRPEQPCPHGRVHCDSAGSRRELPRADHYEAATRHTHHSDQWSGSTVRRTSPPHGSKPKTFGRLCPPWSPSPTSAQDGKE